MHRLFVLHKLRPGVDADQFIEWSRSVDQPVTGKYRQCRQFDVYRVVHSKIAPAVPFDFVEEVVVDDYSEWIARLAEADHRPIAEGFDALVDPDGVQIMVCDVERI